MLAIERLVMSTADELNIRHLNAPDTQAFLRGILDTQRCVPFLGAGFTAGEKSRGGRVPSGDAWLQVMKQQIASAPTSDKPSSAELNSYGFQATADIYFREDIVPLELIKATVNERFTDVRIRDQSKLEFLRLGWPYIYTLNIDDALEKSIDAIKVLPYRAFTRFEGRQFVYKLHGDADDVLAAPSRENLDVIFGRGDYVRGLDRNRPLLGDLTTDFAEKNLLFVGCSLTDELDVLFALAGVKPDSTRAKTARIYITHQEPADYTTKRLLRSYGITDVIVGDYALFYAFCQTIVETRSTVPCLLKGFEYNDNAPPHGDRALVEYMVQTGWSGERNPYLISIERQSQRLLRKRLPNPLTIISGRRFSGKTTLLHRILNENRARRRFLIPSTTQVSLALLNEVLLSKDSLIAIDTDALNAAQLSDIRQKMDRLRENNVSVIIARNNSDYIFDENNQPELNIDLSSSLQVDEAAKLDLLTSPLGFQRWNSQLRILDNLFIMAESPIVKGVLKSNIRLSEAITAMCDNELRSETLVTDFMVLYYLAVKSKMPSRVYRSLVQQWNPAFSSDVLIHEFVNKWAPFVELSVTDAATHSVFNSSLQLVSNSHAWIQLSLRKISTELGVERSAEHIARLYSLVRGVDPRAYDLILFDKINAIYETRNPRQADWRARMIGLIYEKLRTVLFEDANYWLQRAKSVYYLSLDPEQLRVAIAYVNKGITEINGKTSINATLTKANLWGKLCLVTDYKNDEDLVHAVSAYAKAVGQRRDNPAYVSELLLKSKEGRGYMNKLHAAAVGRGALLQDRESIKAIGDFIGQSFRSVTS